MVICSYRIDFIIIIIIVLRFVLHIFAFIAFFNGRMQFLYSTHYKSFQFVILFFVFGNVTVSGQSICSAYKDSKRFSQLLFYLFSISFLLFFFLAHCILFSAKQVFP